MGRSRGAQSDVLRINVTAGMHGCRGQGPKKLSKVSRLTINGRQIVAESGIDATRTHSKVLYAPKITSCCFPTAMRRCPISKKTSDILCARNTWHSTNAKKLLVGGPDALAIHTPRSSSLDDDEVTMMTTMVGIPTIQSLN
jgi:hypothetical protein